MIAAVLLSVFFASCSPSTKSTTDRAEIDAILNDHGLPDLPTTAKAYSGTTLEHPEYDEIKIQFVCTPIECAQYVSKVPGAPAHDNPIAQDEIVRHLKTGPAGQVLRDRRAADEPNHTYIAAERGPGGVMAITIELEDIR